jgi:hypothetical protein
MFGFVVEDEVGEGAEGPVTFESEEIDGFDGTFLVAIGGSANPRLAVVPVLANRPCC